MLEFALVNFAISSALKAGFTPVIPPVLVNPAAMEGTGFLGQAAENVYHLEKDDVYLVGTSEVPLAAMHMDEVLPADKLPIRYAGYSSCFRREAGNVFILSSRSSKRRAQTFIAMGKRFS
jgi:seryl-tRNA synthetase